MTVAERIPLEALVRLPSFYAPVPSWDGGKVAYYGDQTGRIELYVLEVASGETTRVTDGQLPRTPRIPVAWNRAGTAVAFARDLDGNEQHDVWLLDLASGQTTQLTDSGRVQEIPIEFSPDDEWLSMLSTRNGQMNLFKVKRDGSDVVQLTSFKHPVELGGQWSPDGQSLLAVSNDTPTLHNSDVYVVSADGETRKVFSSGDQSYDRAAGWSPDGSSLAVTSDASGVDRAGILDLQSGEVRWLGEPGAEMANEGFSTDGRFVLGVRNADAAFLPVLFTVETGEQQSLPLPTGASLAHPGEAAFVPEHDAVLLRISTDTSRPALLLYDLQAGEARTLIAPEYGSIDPALFVPAEDVHYQSFDGCDIHALLYRPREIPDGARLPAIVMPHGGPTWQYSHGFVPLFQFLADRGYVLLLPNIRGSTGYGVEFRDMARMDWGGADLQDLVAGREYLASLPYVDPDRIGVSGGSYGGYMTFVAMTKAPEYWKAGVAIVGITDLRAMYAESMPHFKSFLEEQMGNPEENADLWRDRSALFFAEHMTGHLLIIHGVNDPRCPISQARLFRDRLIELGKVEGRDFEYVELGEEGHGSMDQNQRLREYRLMEDYLSRVL